MSDSGTQAASQKTKLQFEPVETQDEAKSLLEEAATTLASTLIWTRNREQVLTTCIDKIKDADKILFARFPKIFSEPDFLQTLKTTGTNDCYFSVSLSRANLFFRTPFIRIEASGLKFSVPKDLFKVQRRKDLRYKIPLAVQMHVDFPDTVDPNLIQHKRVLDISAGGLSFLISPEERELYPTGKILDELKFQLGETWIISRGEVKYTRPLNDFHNKKDWILGVSFVGIPPGHSAMIAKFVFNENRKLFARLF